MLLKNIDENTSEAKLNFCSFTSWYKNYEKITIRSICIPIPEDILEYFRDELVVLPKECYGDSYDTLDEQEWDVDLEDKSPEFPDFSNQLKTAIEELDGSVFIKTNWHCPKDAYWITAGQTLKVKDIADAYQLIKASSIIKKDLNFCYLDDGKDEKPKRNYNLILKEWVEIHPGTEFRCFVRNRNLIAISPRDWPQFHKHILQQRYDIIQDIVSLFEEKIQHNFPLSDFCFDVMRQCKDKVILIDFSPFDEEFTEALAFDWSFLKNVVVENNEQTNCPEFRYLNEDCGIQPNRRNNYAIPQDIMDMFNSPSSLTGSNFADFLAAKAQEETERQNQPKI